MQHLFRRLNHFRNFRATLNSVLVGISFSAALGVSPEVSAAAATDVKCSRCVENADVGARSIGTAKLRNASVTTEKLAPNAVTSAKLQNGVVTTEKLAPNAVRSSNILNGSVTAGKLANGAVTSLNIAEGAVTAEKLALGVLVKPKNVIHVANEGGEFTDPGQAVSSITNASASNRYLVVIAPGVYEGSPLSTQPYIDVAGSGEHNTIIKTNASVYVAPNSELRDLTIENVSDSIDANALNMTSGSPRLTRVTVTITASNTDFAYAIYGSNASPVMNHVTAVASGAAVSNWAIYAHTSSSAVPLIMNDTTAIATGGAYSTAVEAPAKFAILTRVIFTASGAQNENIALKTESCCGNLTITDMIATSTGGIKASAFYAYGGSPKSSLTLTRSTLKAAAASGLNVGLDIQNYNAMVSHSTIVGAVDIDSGTKCVFVDDGNGDELNIICT